PAHEAPLDPSLPTVANAFKDAGYHTAWLGKWHVDGYHESEGRAAMHTVERDRRGGFDTWIGYENNNAQYDCHVHGHRGDQEVERYRLPGHETDALTDLLLEHLDERAGDPDTPFFAALSVQPPHNPYVAPEQWMTRHTPGRMELRPNVPAVNRVEQQARRDLAGYYAQIEHLDHNVGRVMTALADLDLTDDTWIIFFSDHGDMHGSHGQFKKTSPWEESIRVPMIIGGPSRYLLRAGQSGHISDAPINHVDLIPTSLGLCGLGDQIPDDFVGTNWAGHVRGGAGQPDEPDSAYLQLVEPPPGHADTVDRPWRGLVTRDGWKYACLEGQPWLMFNLNEDPFEQANLAHNPRFAGRRKELNERLQQWIDETGDEFQLPK
ncbi:MAG: sulfatase-like hydrolase/transferase, partial [Phycisphaeraceae bacterium]|nr:sulfatase-like hydrolase/transferase [Phycisphaeraceae bacterium]